MEETNIHRVAEYFLALSTPGTSRSITPLKLQKLVYYAQALSHPFNNRYLFKEDFEAWVHGPVSPELYYNYKKYRSKDIQDDVKKPNINPDDAKVIEAVWQIYGEKDGKFLENKTHNEKPWKETRSGLSYYESSNKIIPKEKIKEYYSEKFKVAKN
ncbi:type II toxin-antitoxin system antitoxin SocA domain-containing protein [Halobacillus sp. HZG1]|uniref:Panacea domain-containing protein n=1 Tax=Halobacillus sp. HZG1 TaxID=3111769 RepID=UPI002DB951C5|nr:type II toxin-antitoxin system antitoxin SocA domain-containing protein [Halobacillus sp. HZG1]MEC3885513.1 type II toxin-antitoxin system antitoxin SocA domain-containing protein [Halobacillus sp. HZG1]